MWQQFPPKFPRNISSDPRRMRWGIAMMLALVRNSKILTIHGLKNYLNKPVLDNFVYKRKMTESNYLITKNMLFLVASKISFLLAGIFVMEEFRVFFECLSCFTGSRGSRLDADFSYCWQYRHCLFYSLSLFCD